jgi:hypothetical protein
MNKTSLLISCILAICLMACKARKMAGPAIVKPNVDSTVKQATAQDLLGFTLKDWRYFSARIDIEYQNGDNKQNFEAKIHMLKDSLVWISAGLFGIEGARVLVNTDSMVVLNRLNKNYSVYKNESVSGFSDVPLTVGQIQNLIIGQPAYALNLYKIMSNTDANISIAYKQEKFTTSHHYRKQFYTIDTTSIQDKTSRNYAMATYQDYTSVNNHNFPLSSYINASNQDKLIHISMKFKDVDFESPVSFSFNIPGSYERTK